jgi:hypothetical protein
LKIIYNSFIFFINFIFAYLTLLRIESNYPEIILKSLENVSQDLLSIGLPYQVNIQITLIVALIAVLNTLFIYVFVSINFKTSEVLEIMFDFIKLFFINTGIIFTVLYLFRFFDLSRGTLFLNIVIFPFLFIAILIFIEFLKNLSLKTSFIKKTFLYVLVIVFIGLIYFAINSLQTSVSVEYANIDFSQTESVDISSIPNDEPTCFPWVGSDNFKECSFGSSSDVELSFGKQINNIITNNGLLYVLAEEGLIYQYNGENSSLILDISQKVLTEDSGEEGLFGLAFHPTENFFLVSYANLQNTLIVEKFPFTNNAVEVENSEIVYQLPNSQCCHWGGNIIWSEYFEDFIISVGDMEDNERALLSSKPIETTSPKGKLLLLNKEITNSPLISVNKNATPLANIVASGLRNPWKTLEYDNKLFIVDIGLRNYEELTVIDLSKNDKNNFNSKLLGWPIFEGPFETIDTYTIDVENNETGLSEKYGFNGALSFISKGVHYLDTFYWNDNFPEAPNEYVLKESIAPQVYYDHATDSTFRAALIGGDVLNSNSSEYDNHYFFSDYLTKEIFSYEYSKDEVTIYPQSTEVDGFITSLVVNPFEDNSLFISTSLGEVINIKLP